MEVATDPGNRGACEMRMCVCFERNWQPATVPARAISRKKGREYCECKCFIGSTGTPNHTPPLLFSSLISEEEAATAWVKNSEEKAFLARPARGGVRRRHPSPGYQPPRRGGSQLQKKLLYYSPQRSQYKNGGGPVHWRVCEQKCGHRRPSGLQNSKPGVVEASEQGGQSQTDIAPRTTNTATNVPTAVAVFFLAST